MTAMYISTEAGGNDRIVPRPRRTDAIGATLRGAYGAALGLSAEMTRLLQRLDGVR